MGIPDLTTADKIWKEIQYITFCKNANYELTIELNIKLSMF